MVYAASFTANVTDALTRAVSVGVRVVIFLVIIGLGWLVARGIRKGVAKLLNRVGFDRAAQRGGLNNMLRRTTASDLTARLVEYAFLLLVLQLAFGAFGPNPVSDLISKVIAWLPKFFVAIVIIIVAAAIAGRVKELITDSIGGLSYGQVVGRVAQWIIVALGLIAALNQMGVAVSVTEPLLIAFLAAVVGIVVVGLGGGLIKPMQHRWERMLNRAETETALAAEHVRANRANKQRRERAWDQPAYAGSTSTDVKPPATPASADVDYEEADVDDG